MAIQTRNLRTDVDHQLQLLCADVADVAHMLQLLENPDSVITAELRSWQSEWPDVIARLKRMDHMREAGVFSEQQNQVLDTVLQRVHAIDPHLRRMGVTTPSL